MWVRPACKTSMKKLNTADVLGEEFVEVVGLTLGRNCLPLHSSMWVALHALKRRLFQASIPTRMGDGIPSSYIPDFIEYSFIDSVPDSIEVSESNYMSTLPSGSRLGSVDGLTFLPKSRRLHGHTAYLIKTSYFH